MSEFLTIQEVADRLKVSLSTATKLVKEGKIKSVRIASLLRVPVEALAEFAKSASKSTVKRPVSEKQKAARAAFADRVRARVRAKNKPTSKPAPAAPKAPVNATAAVSK